MLVRGLIVSILALAFLGLPATATNLYCSVCSGGTFNAPSQFSTDTAGFSMTYLTFVGDPSPATFFTDTGVTFTAGSNNALQILSGQTGFTGNVLRATSSSSLTIAFSGTVTTFGFYFGDYGFNNAPFTVTVDSNSPYTLTTNNAGSSFFGFVGSAPISTITITSNWGSGASFQLGSFEFGAGPDTTAPEATTSLMIGSGLILLPSLRRLRTRLRRGRVEPAIAAG